MSDYLELTKDFIHSVRNHEICKEYFRQRDMVSSQYPELKGRIDEFRKRSYLLQNSTDADRLFDEIDRFEKEFEEFRKNSIVDRFLASELAFCRMYQEIDIMLSEEFARDFD